MLRFIRGILACEKITLLQTVKSMLAKCGDGALSVGVAGSGEGVLERLARRRVHATKLQGTAICQCLNCVARELEFYDFWLFGEGLDKFEGNWIIFLSILPSECCKANTLSRPLNEWTAKRWR